jgi:putative chitinase
MLNRTNIFNSIRKVSGSLSQTQVDSIDAILDQCDKRGITDIHKVAYILATVKHESNFKPVEENGKGKGRDYGNPDPITHQIYFGRGLVQITWKGNYSTFGKILGIDLVNRPELALQTDYAAEIAVMGMANGLFTGKRLDNYFTGVTNDPVNARRIINGTDKAELIAGYYNNFLDGMK